VATAQFLKSTYTVVVIVGDREKEAQTLAAQGLNVVHTADNGVNTVDDKVGSADIEDAMKGLVKPTQCEADVTTVQVLKATHTAVAGDEATQEETRMTNAQVLNVAHKVAHTMDNGVKAVDDKIGSAGIEDAMKGLVKPTQGEADVTTVQVLKVTHTAVASVDDSEEAVKDHLGRTDVEDAWKRVDEATQEEARMTDAQVLDVTHPVDNGVKAIDEKVGSAGIEDAMKGLVKRMRGEAEVLKWPQRKF
jgi:hypothetical protein